MALWYRSGDRDSGKPIEQAFDNFQPHPAAEMSLQLSVVGDKIESLSTLQNINIKINSVTKSYKQKQQLSRENFALRAYPMFIDGTALSSVRAPFTKCSEHGVGEKSFQDGVGEKSFQFTDANHCHWRLGSCRNSRTCLAGFRASYIGPRTVFNAFCHYSCTLKPSNGVSMTEGLSPSMSVARIKFGSLEQRRKRKKVRAMQMPNSETQIEGLTSSFGQPEAEKNLQSMVARNSFNKCVRVKCSTSSWLWCTQCFDYGYAKDVRNDCAT